MIYVDMDLILNSVFAWWNLCCNNEFFFKIKVYMFITLGKVIILTMF